MPLLLFVTDDKFSAVLGLDTSEKLNILRRCNVSAVNDVISDFSDCYIEMSGWLSVTKVSYWAEVWCQARNHTTTQSSALIETPDEKGTYCFIEPIDAAFDWVNALVIVKKTNGNLVICLDSRLLNQAIKRHHHQLPTTDRACDMKLIHAETTVRIHLKWTEDWEKKKSYEVRFLA